MTLWSELRDLVCEPISFYWYIFRISDHWPSYWNIWNRDYLYVHVPRNWFKSPDHILRRPQVIDWLCPHIFVDSPHITFTSSVFLTSSVIGKSLNFPYWSKRLVTYTKWNSTVLLDILMLDDYNWPLLLTWIYLNPSMDKWSHPR